MRILFLSNVFPNSQQPLLGTFNGALVRALSRRHDVRVIAPVPWTRCLTNRAGWSVPAELGLDGDHVAYPTYFYTPRIGRHLYGRMMWASIGRMVVQAIRDFNADAIVSYWTHPDGEVAVRAGRATDRPVVTMVGGSDVLLLGRAGPRRKAILNVLSQADAVVPVSCDLANKLAADGVAPDKLHVVYRGVDTTRFSPGDRSAARARLGLPTDEFLTVGVGRLVPVKQWQTMISACAMLRERHSPITCYVLGEGPLRGPLTAQADSSGCADCFHLPGGIPHASLPDWYRAADVITLPSQSEGVPNVLLEAICCGSRFVGSQVGGIPEIADEAFDRLYPSGEVEALAAAWEELRDAPPTVDPTRRRFQPLSWEASAARLTTVIQETRGDSEPHTAEAKQSTVRSIAAGVHR